MSKKILELLTHHFRDAILETHSQFGDDTAIVLPSKWQEVALFLRCDESSKMDMFTDLTAVDYLGQYEKRFEVVCHLRSVSFSQRIRIKTRIGDQDGSNSEIDSLVPVWKGANWFERETFDMFGIHFVGHPDLRRILLYEEFVGHPLRKDYAANKIQPLIPFRKIKTRFGPFGNDEGMSFGRKTNEYSKQED